MLKSARIAILGLCLSSAGALAGPWQDAQEQIRRGDFVAALPLLVAAANAPGEPNAAAAQYTVGSYYEYGTGTAVDLTQAARWYRKAAESGHVQAEVALGSMYAQGRGVAQDYTEAAKWLGMAAKANAGNKPAATTDGVKPD